MARLWGIIRKNHRIRQEYIASVSEDGVCAAQEGVREICYHLDISLPVWLDKHTEEIERFGRTVFRPSDFLEPVDFDRFEVEFLRERHRSADPRNDFGTEL